MSQKSSRPDVRRSVPRWVAGIALLAAMLPLVGCDDAVRPEDRLSFIADAVGDFLPSFAGPRNADLDAVRGEVTLDGAAFTFSSTSAGTIGTTPGALYVWGVNRGRGTARFGDLAPGVLFDAVVVLRADGTGQVVDFTSAASPVASPLPAGSVTIRGAEVTGRVPTTLLPGQGLQPAQYTVNLWPRTGLGRNDQIADFAPDNRNVPVRVVR